MTISRDEFLEHLEAANLLEMAELREWLDALPDQQQPADGAALAKLLVAENKLTSYQAQVIFRGKGNNLTLGNYVIQEKLGQGGMGMVFRAQHRKMKREVALKVVSAKLANNPDTMSRFQREVEAAAKLHHPNIVVAFDADDYEGTFFLVMEVVEGKDLSSIVKKKGPVKIPQAVDLIVQSARGLQYAHEQGVIHRDIKPSNLLLDKSGTVKILDMGLARIEAEVEQTELTNTGMVMGTIDYMAPEQAVSTKHVDARSDIYSLGCSLWYLLTARSTYEGETAMGKLLAHREHPIPSLIEARDDATPELQGIFEKMVAKRVEDRYPSMQDVIADLEKFQSGDPSLSGILKKTSAEESEDGNLRNFLAGLGNDASSPAPTRVQTEPTIKKGRAGASDVTRVAGTEDVGTDPQSFTLPANATDKTRVIVPTKALWWQDRKIQAAMAGGVALLILLAVMFSGGDELPPPGTPKTASATPTTPDVAAENTDQSNAPAVAANSPSKPDETLTDDPLKTFSSALNKSNDPAETTQSTPLVATKPTEPELSPAPPAQPEPAVPKPAEPSPHALKIELDGKPPRPEKWPFDEKKAQRLQQRWAKHLSLETEIENSLGMKFALIPPGEFQMGVTKVQHDFLVTNFTEYSGSIKEAYPPIQTQIEKPFYLGTTEVTQQLFMDLMGQNPAQHQPGGFMAGHLSGKDNTKLPVEAMTWLEAVEFCNKLSEKEGLQPCYQKTGDSYERVPQGTGYRLPLESEWEFACRAGNDDLFWPPSPPANPDLKNIQSLHQFFDRWIGQFESTASSNINDSPSYPATFQANPFGLYDMHGNFMELCDSPFFHFSEIGDETVDFFDLKPGTGRAVKGGYYREGGYSMPELTAAARRGQADTQHNYNVSFRVVRVIPLPQDETTPETKPSSPEKPADANTSKWQLKPELKGREPRLEKWPFTPTAAQKSQERWAKHLSLETDYENSLGMKFKLIPPGEFKVGHTPERFEYLKQFYDSPDVMEASYSTSTQTVRLTRPFYILSTEASQRAFETLMESNPSQVKPEGGRAEFLRGRNHLDFPVETTTWLQAIEFCNKLSESEGLVPCYKVAGDKVTTDNVEWISDGTGYRLPTSAEWEFAGLAGAEGFFWFGDPPQVRDRSAPVDQWKALYQNWIAKAERFADSGAGPAISGTLPANPFGLHNIHGNVEEWVWDWMEPYKKTDDILIDPRGPKTGTAKILRSGSFIFGGYKLPLFAGPTRQGVDPKNYHPGHHVPGLRVVRVIPLAQEETTPETKPSAPVKPADAKTSKWELNPEPKGEKPQPTRWPFGPKDAQDLQKSWAKHLSLKIELRNSEGLSFKLIPPGEFKMGIAPERFEYLEAHFEAKYVQEAAYSTPQQSVKLTRPFYLLTTEISQGHYQKLMGENPSKTQPGGENQSVLRSRNHLNFPVEGTSWIRSVEFCNKLSDREGLKPCYKIQGDNVALLSAGTGYRLPTSAEWEYAAMAGQNGFFWFGDPQELPNRPQAEWIDLYQNLYINAERFSENGYGPMISGSLPANPFGLHDVHGNVEEWVWDWFAPYTQSSKVLIDPVGPSTGNDKVIRSGNYGHSKFLLPKFIGPGRNGIEPKNLIKFPIGFRIVRVIPYEPAEEKK